MINEDHDEVWQGYINFAIRKTKTLKSFQGPLLYLWGFKFSTPTYEAHPEG
jgi:hypothetical protein